MQLQNFNTWKEAIGNFCTPTCSTNYSHLRMTNYVQGVEKSRACVCDLHKIELFQC